MPIVINSTEGFDSFADTAELQSRYGSNFSLEESDLPFGFGKAAEMTSDSSISINIPTGLTTAPEDINVLYTSARVKTNSTLLAGSNESGLVSVLSIHNDSYSGSDGAETCGLFAYTQLTNTLSCRAWNKSFSIVGFNINDDVWHTLEIVSFPSESNAWMQWYLDGDMVHEENGWDSIFNNNHSAHYFGGCGMQGLYDDLIFGYSATNLTYPGAGVDWAERPGNGDLVVYPLVVDGDNGTNQMTPTSGTDHYAMVDEGDADDDTTALTATGTGETEEFTMADLPAGIGTIYGVFGRVRAAAETADTISEALTLFTKHSANSADQLTIKVTGDWTWSRWADMSINPSTGSIWTASELNAGIVGVKT